jgi:hypothetical protein
VNRFDFQVCEFERRIKKWGGSITRRPPSDDDLDPPILIHFRVGIDSALDNLVLSDAYVGPTYLADEIARRALYAMKETVDKKLVELEQDRFNRIHATASLHPTEQDTPKAPEAGR